MPDREAFERAQKKILEATKPRLGIGTLAEKSIHAILKNYYDIDDDHQEIPVENYVADIYHDGKIIEIQTRQMGKLREKLKTFLPLYQVTVVHPITMQKTLIWLDGETGLFSKMRKSPKKGNVYMAFPELYTIKMFLKDPNLKLKLVLLAVEEYRLVNIGDWNRDTESTTYDKIPTAIVEEVEINCLQDYMQFVPSELDGPFTSRRFAKAANISLELAQATLNILYYVGTITRVGKIGNQYLYEVLDI